MISAFIAYRRRLEQDSKPGHLKNMGRPAEHEIMRLAYRVWAARLRHALSSADVAAGRPPITRWEALEHRLVNQLFDHPLPAPWDLKGLSGVARRGADPRRLQWRIKREDANDPRFDAYKTVTRRASGPAAGSGAREAIAYVCIPFNAVELGERLVPGSKQWLSETFWWLASARNPSVEDVRYCIALSLRRLGLVRPTLDERRRFIGEQAYQEAAAAPQEEVLSVYRAALEAIASVDTADAMSLVMGLVWESYLTDEDELHKVHRAVAKAAFDRWLSPPLMEPLRTILTQQVLVPILCGIPIRHPRPTNPRELPIPVAQWTAMLQSELPIPIQMHDLPALELGRPAFSSRPVD